ncbi:MAG TPA: amidohydrolase family protein [Chitinophagaceae bacterium]
MLKRIIVVITVLLLLKGVVSAQNTSIAIINAKVYPSPTAKPISNATILISDGKIKAVGAKNAVKIPASYEVMDMKGKVITAGFWNCHVHFIEPHWTDAGRLPADTAEKYLKAMLSSHGFAYAFDLAALNFSNLKNLRGRINDGEITGPTILAVGVPFTSASPYYIRPAVLPELKNAQQVSTHLEQQLEEGVNGIKIWTASPVGGRIDYMPDSLIKVAAAFTSRNKIPLFSHPTNIAGAIRAVKNGVTVLTHTSPDDRHDWDPLLVKELVKANVALIPTLKLCTWDISKEERETSNDLLLKTAVTQLSSFHKAGGVVLFGTDVGYMTDYNPLDEFVYMGRSGMSFSKILASLTVNPAKKFGYEKKTGKIEVGLDADLVILNSDPAVDVRNFTDVHYTIRKGIVIYEGKK